MSTRTVIGHRGAAAYAPENTLPSFELALEQGADCVEHDLHATKDGILVCLHDRTLERTTNVRELFPDRGRAVEGHGPASRRWFVHDFTLSEVRQLDAGAWFDARFAGTRVPTFQEAIACVTGRGALVAELKDPEVYAAHGIDLLSLFEAELRGHGTMVPAAPAAAAPPTGPPLVTVQSFHEPTMRRAAERIGRRVPVVLLIEPADGQSFANRRRITELAPAFSGIGPGKALLERFPEMVAWAHDAGLRVTPWTFRAATPGRFENVSAEMAHYLTVLQVDGVITDNPDLAPRPGTKTV